VLLFVSSQLILSQGELVGEKVVEGSVLQLLLRVVHRNTLEAFPLETYAYMPHSPGCRYDNEVRVDSDFSDFSPVFNPASIREDRWSSYACFNGQRDWWGMVRNPAGTYDAVHERLFQTEYVYESLPAHDSIRILHLHPISLSHSDTPLSGTLHSTTLRQKPSYQALSYVWGDQIETVKIKINGSIFRIGRSLKSALMHLRSSSDQIVKLWVDAICLNQKDYSKKSHQVKNMGRIYNIAEQVIVWLGPGPYGSLAFEDAERIVKDEHFRSQYLKNWKSPSITKRL
jgi:hypothetical protein